MCLLAAGLVPGANAQEPELRVPEGFRVRIFADDLDGPRWLTFGPDGALYASLSRAGRVVRLRDGDRDGRADSVETVLDGLTRPHGLAWREGELWVAEMTRVVRVAGAMASDAGREPTVVVEGIPEGGHWTRTLIFEPDGSGFLLSIGSSCNVCREEDPRRAAIVRYALDGTGEEVWARGLRNSVGLAVNPRTGELWATNNGRDWLGDDLPPEELNAIRRGGDYGWPFCYGNRIPNPEYGDRARCAGTEAPILTFQAHSAPLGISFYTGSTFPEGYRGDAFVAFHGSWNRSVPTGYKVVRVHVREGRPVEVTDFVSGWLTDDLRVLGRPVHPLVGPDGALYVSDDAGGRIWRVSYGSGGEPARPRD